MAAGVLVFGAWGIWFFIIVAYPVSMPVSLAVGEVRTPEFRAYVNESYSINIVAKKRLPLQVLDCMLGISTGPLDPYNCGKGAEPLLQAKWTLWSEGKIVAQGSSDDHKGWGGWGNKTVERNLGIFKTKSGRKYVLQMDFTKDGTPLAITDPRLVIEVSHVYPTEEENTEITICSTLFVLMEVIGFGFLFTSAVRCWRNRSKRSMGTT